MQNPPVGDLWRFLPRGYLLTVLIESPFLWLLLPKLKLSQRFWLGLWLTACTYPIVVLVMPTAMDGVSRGVYLLVAETFAPLAECCLFWLSIRGQNEFTRKDWLISFATITLANLASFAIGEMLWLSGLHLNA
ncbi:MAG: hypothetical protein SFV81_21555 [Pirellulaceae bacterium]|nr:hypothetical protein [Pirellulaceae bacterium]